MVGGLTYLERGLDGPSVALNTRLRRHDFVIVGNAELSTALLVDVLGLGLANHSVLLDHVIQRKLSTRNGG